MEETKGPVFIALSISDNTFFIHTKSHTARPEDPQFVEDLIQNVHNALLDDSGSHTMMASLKDNKPSSHRFVRDLILGKASLASESLHLPARYFLWLPDGFDLFTGTDERILESKLGLTGI